MKFSTLLEVIGSGTLLLFGGVVVFLLGIGYGFSEFAHLPLWVCLCGLGLLAGIVGFALVDRGSEEAEEQVMNIPMIGNFRHNPWFAIGGAIVGGFLLERMFRKRPKIVVAEIVPARSPSGDATLTGAEPPAPRVGESNLLHFVGDQARSLGAMAASTAVAIAWQRLGVPLVNQVLDSVLGSEQPKEPSFASRTRPRERADATASRESFGTSNNGAHR